MTPSVRPGTTWIRSAISSSKPAPNLKQARQAPTPPDNDAGKAPSFRQVMIRDMVPPDAAPTLQRLIATTTVASSILSDLQQLPAENIPFLNDKDQLSQMADGVDKLATTTQQVATFIGTSPSGADAEANQGISRIEDALGRVVELIQTYRDKITEMQGKARGVRVKLDSGILWGAVGTTVLLAWFIIAQISLFAHAWSWLRRPAVR